MDTQTQGQDSKNIHLKIDEFDIETYDFKPITDGLGFNEPKKKKTQSFSAQRAAQKSEPKPLPVSGQHKHMKGTSRHLQSTPTSVSNPALMNGIEAIYGRAEDIQSLTEETHKKAKKVPKEISLKEASLGSMIFAFAIDTLVVFSITALLFSLFFVLSYNQFELSVMQYFVMSSLPFIATLWALIFLTYFSLLEPVGTFGKKLMGIGCFSTHSKKRATIRQSFVRAAVTLFSLPLLFIPLVLDFQGKLSDTGVYKLK